MTSNGSVGLGHAPDEESGPGNPPKASTAGLAQGTLAITVGHGAANDDDADFVPSKMTSNGSIGLGHAPDEESSSPGDPSKGSPTTLANTDGNGAANSGDNANFAPSKMTSSEGIGLGHAPDEESSPGDPPKGSPAGLAQGTLENVGLAKEPPASGDGNGAANDDAFACGTFKRQFVPGEDEGDVPKGTAGTDMDSFLDEPEGVVSEHFKMTTNEGIGLGHAPDEESGPGNPPKGSPGLTQGTLSNTTDVKEAANDDDACACVTFKRQFVPSKDEKDTQKETAATDMDMFLVGEQAGMASTLDGKEDENYIKLEEDIYSFLLVTNPREPPFLFALFIFLFMIALYALILIDIIDVGSDNPFNIPAGVTPAVSFSQFLLLPLAVAVETPLILSIVMFRNGYNPEILRSAPDATYGSWILSYGFKFILGIVSIFTNFSLMIQSETVIDIFLNFAALGMVCSTADVMYSLSKHGFVSDTLQAVTKEIEELRVPKSTMVGTRSYNRFFRCVVFLILWPALVVSWAVVFMSQRTGRWLCQNVDVQFGDEFNADLAGFSGTYSLVDKRVGDRNVYMEDHGGRAMFAYCEEEGAWTFSYGTGELDPCQYKAKSIETVTYDITELNPPDWFVGTADDSEPKQFQFMSLVCLVCEESDAVSCAGGSSAASAMTCLEGRYGSHCQFPEPCLNLDIAPGTRFRYFRNSRIFKGFWMAGEHFSPLLAPPGGSYAENNATYQRRLMVNDRPVYAYEYSSELNYTQLNMQDQSGFFEIVLFTGRRWVFTNSELLVGLRTTDGQRTDRSNLIEYFASFHSHFSDYEALYISDPTDFGTPTDAGTPERLSWYKTAAGTNNEAEGPLGTELVLLCSCSQKNPCFSGTCEDRIGKYNDTYQACQCVQGFGGSLCQDQCDDGYTGYKCDMPICDKTTVCSNGGTCEVSKGLLNTTMRRCECPQGFGGEYCGTECSAGYTGRDCDESICTDEVPCRNGGICTVGMTERRVARAYRFCDCPQGYGDLLCQEECEAGYQGVDCDVPVCSDTVPCLNDGVCDIREGVSGSLYKFCSCQLGFAGTLCETACPPGYTGPDCDEVYCGDEFPCQHGGACEVAIGEKNMSHTFCKCREGFGGSFCEDECRPGYTGVHCDEVACGPAFPCKNRGTCKAQTKTNGDSYRYCSCPLGYGGPVCERKCPPGFSGLNCNEKTCGSAFPCLNNGTCVPVGEGPIVAHTYCQCHTGYGGFFCGDICPYGLSGAFCDERSMCSAELPCLNNGTCIFSNDTGVSSCSCRQGYGGHFCEHLCPEGFTGQRCDERADCSGNETCQNGGVCMYATGLVANSTALDFTSLMSNSTVLNFTSLVSNSTTLNSTSLGPNSTTHCQCPIGYGGFLCDFQCADGYSGYACNKQACGEQFPCQNGGVCEAESPDAAADFVCKCPTGYGGFFCDVECPYGFTGYDCNERMRCSDELPCLNDGTCEMLRSDIESSFCECQFGFGGAFCQVTCPIGYTGTHCGQRASCGDEVLCQNEGLCTVQKGSTGNITFSSCDCPLGFGGALCQIRCPLGFTGPVCDQLTE